MIALGNALFVGYPSITFPIAHFKQEKLRTAMSRHIVFAGYRSVAKIGEMRKEKAQVR